MEASFTDNLVNLKNHCLLCYRERVDDDESGQSETTGKHFVKLLARHLCLPPATLTVERDEVGGDPTTVTIGKRWERLLKGNMCSTCSSLAHLFINLMIQWDRTRLDIMLCLQELEQCIEFTDHEVSSLEGKDLLRKKWEAEGLDSQHYFQLLANFRSNIMTGVANMKDVPILRLKRLTDSEIEQYTTARSPTDISSKTKSNHRDSLTEDSGVSSPMSLGSQDEVIVREQSFSPSMDPGESPSPIPTKEFKVMRKVFTCRVCKAKFFSRDKYTDHCETTNHTRPVAHLPLEPTATVKQMKKITYVCRKNDCGGKFLSLDLLRKHINEVHPNTPTQTGEKEKLAASSSIPSKPKRTYKKRNYACEVEDCGKKFHSANELNFHSQFHRSHPCFFCGYECENPDVLAKHELTSHGGETSAFKDVKCPRCSVVSTNFMNYRSHFFTHLGAEMFPCTKCSMHFSKRSIREHVSKCDKAPSTSAINAEVSKENALQKTEMTSAANKAVSDDYVCNICNLHCNSSLALQTHYIAGHDPNILCCNDCERVFDKFESLEKHRAIVHLKVKVIQKYCEYCQKNIAVKSTAKFNSHIKKHKKKMARAKLQSQTATATATSDESLPPELPVMEHARGTNMDAQDNGATDHDSTSNVSLAERIKLNKRISQPPQDDTIKKKIRLSEEIMEDAGCTDQETNAIQSAEIVNIDKQPQVELESPQPGTSGQDGYNNAPNIQSETITSMIKQEQIMTMDKQLPPILENESSKSGEPVEQSVTPGVVLSQVKKWVNQFNAESVEVEETVASTTAKSGPDLIEIVSDDDDSSGTKTKQQEETKVEVTTEQYLEFRVQNWLSRRNDLATSSPAERRDSSDEDVLVLN